MLSSYFPTFRYLPLALLVYPASRPTCPWFPRGMAENMVLYSTYAPCPSNNHPFISFSFPLHISPSFPLPTADLNPTSFPARTSSDYLGISLCFTDYSSCDQIYIIQNIIPSKHQRTTCRTCSHMPFLCYYFIVPFFVYLGTYLANIYVICLS